MTNEWRSHLNTMRKQANPETAVLYRRKGKYSPQQGNRRGRDTGRAGLFQIFKDNYMQWMVFNWIPGGANQLQKTPVRQLRGWELGVRWFYGMLPHLVRCVNGTAVTIRVHKIPIFEDTHSGLFRNDKSWCLLPPLKYSEKRTQGINAS